MAGIIDSFFVQVGLDASQFTIGQREADKAWTKTKDQTVAAAKRIEENTGKLAKSFDLLKRQAIEFFAAIMAADGIASFIENVTEANSKGIADSIADALQLSLHASLDDYGQA